MPEELWMEVCNIVQEVRSKSSPGRRNAKRQNGCLRKSYKYLREEKQKCKGEKERYMNLNAEFQRTARRDKKDFLSDQIKEMKETVQWERLEIS